MPLGSVVVVTAGSAGTTMLRGAGTEVCVPIVTVTVKGKAAPALAFVAVPEMRPLALRLSPAGNEPEASAHETVPFPPPAYSSC